MNKIQDLFNTTIQLNDNFITVNVHYDDIKQNQEHTKDVFSDKCVQANNYSSINKLFEFQFEWFLKLYGFDDDERLKSFLSTKSIIIDTGCGLGYKAAWFAKLAPHAAVLGVDISDSIYEAARNYKEIQNLYFFKGDISNTGLKQKIVDFIRAQAPPYPGAFVKTKDGKKIIIEKTRMGEL